MYEILDYIPSVYKQTVSSSCHNSYIVGRASRSYYARTLLRLYVHSEVYTSGKRMNTLIRPVLD